MVGRRSEKTGNLDTVSQSMKASEFCAMDDETLESLIFDGDGSKWNLYLGVAPIKEHVTLKQRGTEENVTHVTGMWADLDIKPESFQSREEIIEFLFHEIQYRPTIVVASGSGGIHAYWKLAKGEKGNKELVERWWSYLDEAAGDRKIDKLVDLTRILRIPGTVYFPKPDSSAKIGSVEIMYLTEVRYVIEEIKEITESAFKKKHEKRIRLINEDANRRMSMDSFAASLLGNKWRMWRAISEIEDYVNKQMSWAEILEPHSWKWQRTLRDGSNEWARPGRDERSAVVDYEDSPVMSLLSSSEETGLSDLKDAGIALTKYRVLLRLQYEDDEKKMVEDLVDRVLKEDK